MPNECSPQFKACLKEVEDVMDMLHQQALNYRKTYRNNPLEGLRHAQRRRDFILEIQAAFPDGDISGTEKEDEVITAYHQILEKYGFRSKVC